MVMAYLIAEKGMTPAQAQAELRRIRPHVSPRLWNRPTVREIYRRSMYRKAQLGSALAGAVTPGSVPGGSSGRRDTAPAAFVGGGPPPVQQMGGTSANSAGEDANFSRAGSGGGSMGEADGSS